MAMRRLGRWNENRIVFADSGGHRHTGTGNDGTPLPAAALASGCIQYEDGTLAKRKIYHGSTTLTGPGPHDIPSGLSSIDFALSNPKDAVLAIRTSWSGGTVTIESGATTTQSVTYIWMAMGT